VFGPFMPGTCTKNHIPQSIYGHLFAWNDSYNMNRNNSQHRLDGRVAQSRNVYSLSSPYA